MSVILSHPVYGNLYSNPRKLIEQIYDDKCLDILGAARTREFSIFFYHFIKEFHHSFFIY